MATRTRRNPAVPSRKVSSQDFPATPESFSPRQENISVRTFEDQATETDRLGFEPYVKAIARFLTNQDTRPPLVLSIEGEWGSGKTSFMLQLKKQLTGKRPIVWFDPWRYDKEEELWAVFALHFIDQVIKQASLLQRGAGHIKRLIRRYQWREGWFDLAVKTIAWVGLFIIVLLIGQYTFRYGDIWVGKFYKWISDGKLDLYKTFIETGIRLGGVTGFLVLLVYTVGRLMPLIEDPLKVDLRKYIASPDYEDRVPFIKRFQDDFKEILDIYIGQKTVFVFVDDLDRCEVPKAADVMSAINQMIGNDSRVVFIIAMDREKVAAGLAVKYEKLLPYIMASRIYNRSTFSNRELIGLEFGYEFIEKFVQLPFRIPQPDNDKIDNLLVDLQQRKSEKALPFAFIQSRIPDRFKPFLRLTRKTYVAGEDGKAVGGGKEEDQKTVEEPSGGEETAKNKRRESVIIQTGPESAAFIAIVKQVAVAFDYNPRRIKQFINLFRLRVYIAAETGLFDDDLGTNEDHPLTLEKIAKLTALELRWPIFMADIQGEASALIDLQQLAYGITPKALSSRAELWQTRQDLMNFLRIGCPPAGVSNGAAPGPWDLSTVNLTRVMRVSPSIHVINPFVPQEPIAAAPTPQPVLPNFEPELPTPHPAPTGPVEYITLDGKVKHNLAGEFCVAFIGGDDIYEFLKKWKDASPELYHRTLGGDNDRPTGINDLSDMLKVYGYQARKGQILDFRKDFQGPSKGIDFYPEHFQKMLVTHSLIAGVGIEQKTYQLAERGITIWVVLDGITFSGSDEPEAEIYNPYAKGMQSYPFSHFFRAMGGASGIGLWVQRQGRSVAKQMQKA